MNTTLNISSQVHFDLTTYTQSEGNFYNYSTNANNYWYETDPPVYYSADVTLNQTNAPGGCPSSTNNGTISFVSAIAALSQSNLETQFTQNNALWNSERLLRETNIDKGNTQRMVGFLDTSDYSSHRARVRDTLLAASPYLSERALKKAADMEDGISDTVMLEILLANPDGMVSDALIEKLQRRGMSDSWIDSALGNKVNPTVRTYLEDSIQKHASLKQEAAYEIASRILLSEDSIDYLLLRQWLDSMQSPMADAYQAMTYVETALPDTALVKLRGIYNRYNLAKDDSLQLLSMDSALTYYTAWFNSQTDTLLPGEAGVFDSAAIALFDTLASRGNEHLAGTAMLRGVMNTLYGRNYFTPAQLPETGSSKRDEDEDNTAAAIKPLAKQAVLKEEPKLIKVYPNPAKNYVVFELSGSNAMTIEVLDLYGRKIIEKEILPSTPVRIETAEWNSGVYFWKVNAQQYSGKLVIVKW